MANNAVIIIDACFMVRPSKASSVTLLLRPFMVLTWLGDALFERAMAALINSLACSLDVGTVVSYTKRV